ncbi:MAG: hypothetical protein AB4058_07765 [Microcystaceae cyanobacterium]
MMKSSKLLATVGVALLPPALVILPPSQAWGFNQFDVCVGQMVNNGVSPEKAGTACADALIPKELSRCVSMIRAKTAIEPDDALTACYRVRRPIDLAHCVIDIDRALLNSQSTAVVTEPESEAISETGESESAPTLIEENSKNQIKEPILKAQAPFEDNTINLNRQSQFIANEDDSPVLVALDSCRRSLLPGRYSECVTGLGRKANLSPIAAMNTCLEAQAYPADIFPAYNPE